jgi:UV excision repair protein RAD23
LILPKLTLRSLQLITEGNEISVRIDASDLACNMKLTFRLVSGESFQLDTEGSTTVAALKERLSTERNVPLESLKLVYKGKVLDNDAASVQDCGVSEAGFIVLFVQPPKKVGPHAVTAPTGPAPTPAGTATAAAPSTVGLQGKTRDAK